MRKLTLIACLLAPSLATAQELAPVASQPKAQVAEVALSPELNALLDQIEAKAKTIHTMDSRVRLRRKQGLLGDEQVRFGRFRYASARPWTNPPENWGGQAWPAKVQIDFDRVVVDDKAEAVDIRYSFDGYWLLETNAKDHAATRREIRTKDDPHDALAVGGGPLPIPLSFEKKSVLEKFSVRLGSTDPSEDRREAVRLILTPKPGVKAEVDSMILTFEKGTWEPIGTASLHGEDATEVLLSKPAFNGELPKDSFSTQAPAGASWHVEEVPKQ